MQERGEGAVGGRVGRSRVPRCGGVGDCERLLGEDVGELELYHPAPGAIAQLDHAGRGSLLGDREARSASSDGR